MTAAVTGDDAAGATMLDWHPAPRRQYVIVISGQLEIGFGDGTTRRFRPGRRTAGRGYDRARTYDPVCWPRPGDNSDDSVGIAGRFPSIWLWSGLSG